MGMCGGPEGALGILLAHAAAGNFAISDLNPRIVAAVEAFKAIATADDARQALTRIASLLGTIPDTDYANPVSEARRIAHAALDPSGGR
jgi:hypothetical protein